jgi:hypothetical protein
VVVVLGQGDDVAFGRDLQAAAARHLDLRHFENDDKQFLQKEFDPRGKVLTYVLKAEPGSLVFLLPQWPPTKKHFDVYLAQIQ